MNLVIRMKSEILKREYFDERAAGWAQPSAADTRTRIEDVFRTHRLRINSPVADLGSGSGILIPVLQSISGNNRCQIFETDISLAMLRQARLSHARSRTFYLTEADAHHLPFKTNSMASVICFQAFPHFQDKQRALQEVRRILQPGGRFYIIHLMSHQQLNELHRQAGRVVTQDLLPDVEELSRFAARYSLKTETAIERDDLYLLGTFLP